MNRPLAGSDGGSSRLFSTPLVVVLAAGLIVQILLLVVATRPVARAFHGDESRLVSDARTLASGRLPPVDFVQPPLGTWLQGGVLALFGPSRLPWLLAQSLLLLAAGVLIAALARQLGLGPTGGAVAAAVLLLDPQIASFAQYLWPEVPHLVFLLLFALLLYGHERPRRRRALGAGLALGAALLTKSVLLPFVPIALAALVVAPRAAPRRERLLRALAVALGVAALLGPVTIANGLRTGTWRIAASGPLNVWIGLTDGPGRDDWDSVSDRETRAFIGSPATVDEKNRELWKRIETKLRDDGWLAVLGSQLEKQYGRLFDRESFFTDQLPGGRWSPSAPPPIDARLLRSWAWGAYGLTLVLAAFGAFQLRRRDDWRTFAPALILLAGSLAMFLVLHVKTRYRVAFWPAVALLAALAVDRLAAKRGRPGWREAAGLVAAAALLLLAFGNH